MNFLLCFGKVDKVRGKVVGLLLLLLSSFQYCSVFRKIMIVTESRF